MDKPTVVAIPENWDDLTDEQKDAVTAELLKAVADQTGVSRGSGTSGTDGAGESRSRTFTKPT